VFVAVVERERMEQMGGRHEGHAREQREIVASLQKPEVLEDVLLRLFAWRERGVGLNLRTKLGLICTLPLEKAVEQHQPFRRDRGPIGSAR
jgi:hypothetical protein